MNLDGEYRHEVYEPLALKFMRQQCSLPHIFFGKLLLSVPTLLMFFLVGFIAPFFPHPKYGYGTPPASVSDYFTTMIKINLFFIGLAFAICLTDGLWEYFRTMLDMRYGYKKIGSFVVTKVVNRGSFKCLKLTGGQKLKVIETDKNFNTFKIGQVIEIQKTATNKFLSYRILS